ncbi:NAD(P)H-dependent oxidoreductase [Chitinilyticum litopenaei]|uniref:NAD(P)H-dependent oxidoreductase n=1 Tax=Chitinilyticum litopenaei TaxID=1121276 RepID=UPI000412B20C|nr:NAD(P)H-dependent oxidoreductase [Chitinilyticum litopenaei]
MHHGPNPHTLILNGNPKPDSLAGALCDSYQAALAPARTATRLNLHDMVFDPDLRQGYDAVQPLEPALQDWQQQLLRADQLLIVAPVWWGGIPARLKGLFDRSFLPGFAFRYQAGNPWPEPLLRGRRASLILTMDAPAELLAEQAAPVLAQLGQCTLAFSGLVLDEPLLLGSVQASTPGQRADWLGQAGQLARRQSEACLQPA